MKRQLTIGLGIAVVALTIPLTSKLPVVANLFGAGEAIARSMQHPKLQLNLVGEKQVIRKDAQGKEVVSWQSENKLTVRPGDILRYRLLGKNEGDRPIQNLTLNQPVPQGTVFILKSAKASAAKAQVTYSIDGGRTYSANPTVQVRLPNGKVENRPAPAEAYTHIRWNLPGSLPAKTSVNAEYQVKVR